MKEKKYRIVTDSMGQMQVPEGAYWGAQTQRAVENFPISGLSFPSQFIRALGMVKMTCAQANMELGLLDETIGQAVVQAAKEVMEGKWNDHFVVDIFQTGSGTSTNMNANEVIASRANELLAGKPADKSPVHPNDHVNQGQSSNDVIPGCLHIAAYEGIEGSLLPSLQGLVKALEEKSRLFDRIVKIGRTHLQDATPIRLGQEFSGYAAMISHGIKRVEKAKEFMAELALGGTAVGTGINTNPEFASVVIKKINFVTGLPFKEAENHFEAQAAQDAAVETSGALKTLSVSLMKIANDIRWLSSGPRCGIGEIMLPPVQPGSSIMPGKINPVIPEALCQIAAQVIGSDAAITVGGMSGNFELNVMLPVITYNLLQSIHLLANGVSVFTEKCIAGLQADEQRCAEMIEKSLAMCTALSPHIGYDRAAQIAKEAYKTGKTVREVAREKQLLPDDELEKILDPWHMTEPG
ncbi:MAG TPA: class II fumarate hydratase [Thermodesulfovibrionia bacterium]|nr:class II fumarate hydratase [Thermodesulfovibrionia bacterium]